MSKTKDDDGALVPVVPANITVGSIDDYSDLKLSDGAKQKLAATVLNAGTGLISVTPLICFTEEAKILLSDGTLKGLPGVRVGDSVITHEGRTREVTAVLSRPYSGALFSFVYDRNTKRQTPSCTSEHPFLVSRNGTADWVKAADVRTGDYIASVRLESKVSDRNVSEKDRALATVLGYYLAEGCATEAKTREGWVSYYSVTFTFHKDETGYHKELCDALGVLGWSYFVSDPKGSKARSFVVTRKVFTLLMKDLGGKYSYGKRLAPEVFKWPKELLWRVITAYVNGDGHYRPERKTSFRRWTEEISWTTVSPILADQLHTIMLMLGLRPTPPCPAAARVDKLGVLHRASYTGYLRGDNVEAFKQRREMSPSGWNFVTERYVWHRVRRIKTRFAEDEKVYNLSVCGDESFCVSWIVTHNCAGPDDCPFSNRCPIYMADGSKGDYPLKKQCIVELNLARERFMAYVEEFNLQGKVEESPTLRSQISKLADFDIYEYRIKLILAGVAGDSDGSLLIEQSIAVTQGGADVLQIQEHPAWKMLERVQKQRMELLDALGATPKRKVWMDVALKRTDSDNLLAKQRELLERIDGLVEAMEEEK